MTAHGQTKIDLQTQVKGVLSVANGGTGSSSPVPVTGSTTLIASPTADQSASAPTPSLASECPATNSNHPFWWMQDENGNYRTLAAIDTFKDATNGPANATFVFCHHIALNDTGVSPIQGKNAAFSIFHTYGVGSVIGNQDRALSIIARNGTSDSQAHYGMEGIQSEVDLQGTPTVNGSPDGEVSAGSFQLSDTHTNNIPLPHYGANGVRITAFRGGGTYSSCTVCFTALRAEVTNNSSSSFNSGFMVGGYFHVFDQAGGNQNASGVGVWIDNPACCTSARLSNSNTGLRVVDFGTNASDRNIQSTGSMPSSGRNEFQGPLTVGTWTPASSADTCITGTITWDSSFVYVCTATNTWKRAALTTW